MSNDEDFMEWDKQDPTRIIEGDSFTPPREPEWWLKPAGSIAAALVALGFFVLIMAILLKLIIGIIEL